jgi:hypothetical protein
MSLQIECRLEALGRAETEDTYDDIGHRNDNVFKRYLSNGKEADCVVELRRCLKDCTTKIKVLRDKRSRCTKVQWTPNFMGCQNGRSVSYELWQASGNDKMTWQTYQSFLIPAMLSTLNWERYWTSNKTRDANY